MPNDMGHSDGINCMAMIEDKVYTGGRDNALFAWRGIPSQMGFELAQDTPPVCMSSSPNSLLYEPVSKWLFCGLWGGDIQAFCKAPQMEDRLSGHRKSVSSIAVHSGVLISGSNDGTVRLWTMNPQSGRFQAHGQALNNPSGSVSAVRVLNDGLWVGGHTGVSVFDLATLQPKGTLQSAVPVTGMIEFEGHMVVSYRNGDVKIYTAAGIEAFNHPAVGDHTSNTAIEIMMHPTANKAMLLCGQVLGYVTAYDLPEFRARGSFCTRQGSDVRSIVNVKANGMFLTAGAHGDIMMWQWEGSVANAFVPPGAAPVAASPFAPGVAGGGMPGGMPGGGMPGGMGAAFGGCGMPGGGMGHDSMMG